MSAQSLTGRRVLVTGGSAGIGLATSELLLSRGCRLFICGRRKDRLEAAIERMRAGSRADQVSGTLCDVRSDEETEAMVQAAVDFLGGLDALVNSAGVAAVTPFSDLSLTAWREMIDTNLTGVFNCCKTALPWLAKSDRADIVNLGSRAGRYAFAGGTAYNTTKFGLQGFTEALFLDVADMGIAVSLIAPGPVATGFAGAPSQDWHLQPVDVAEVIAGVLASHRRANLNWVEVRPSRRGE